MTSTSESFTKDLFNLLKTRGYKPIPLDTSNKRVDLTKEADIIEFTFIKNGKSYGKVWASIDNSHDVVLYYGNEQQDSPSNATKGLDYDDTWTGLLKSIKSWAQRRQMGFVLSNKDRLNDDMKQRQRHKIDNVSVFEGYYPINKKTSYSDNIPAVKIILQHSKNLSETDLRYRNIDKIFLENEIGERFLAPTKKPGVARIYARHIAEGGEVNDDRWHHLREMCDEYNKLSGFIRATKNKPMNESVTELFEAGAQHQENLRNTLRKLSTRSGYNSYFESWNPHDVTLGDFSVSALFETEDDPRIVEALPILAKLQKPIKEVAELEEWSLSESESTILYKYECELPGKFQPEIFMATSSDEAINKAADAWGILDTENITVKIKGKRRPNTRYVGAEHEGETAIEKAERRAKKRREKKQSYNSNSFVRNVIDKVFEEDLGSDDNPCWSGYTPIGTKKKNGKTVPNCVPKKKA